MNELKEDNSSEVIPATQPSVLLAALLAAPEHRRNAVAQTQV